MSAAIPYRVTFCVRDYYSAEIIAASADEALAIAEDLYAEDGEAPFTFDLDRGGTGEWAAEAVAS